MFWVLCKPHFDFYRVAESDCDVSLIVIVNFVNSYRVSRFQLTTLSNLLTYYTDQIVDSFKLVCGSDTYQAV